MVDEDHHVMSCPLNPLNAGFVSKFGLDYLHLICLGVMRRFLLYWSGSVGPMHVNLLLPVCVPVQIKERKRFSNNRLQLIFPQFLNHFVRQ